MTVGLGKTEIPVYSDPLFFPPVQVGSYLIEQEQLTSSSIREDNNTYSTNNS